MKADCPLPIPAVAVTSLAAYHPEAVDAAGLRTGLAHSVKREGSFPMDSHTILCIDDDEVALQVRKLVLESAGYSVLTARGGEEALKIFDSGTAVDLVLSDHFLQGQTGAQVTAEMKRLRPDVPVVILSGAVSEPEGLGHADLFLPKAGGPAELLQALAALLRAADQAPNRGSDG